MESLRVIENHFTHELNRPEVRHVTVGYKRATSGSERDIIFSSPFLKGLEKDLRAAVPDDGNPNRVRVFGRRYEPTALFNPEATNCGSGGGGSFDSMSVVRLEEPLFQSTSARSLEDWRSGAPTRPLREILAEVEFDPMRDVIVTEHFLLSRLGAEVGTYVPETFCLMVHVDKSARMNFPSGESGHKDDECQPTLKPRAMRTDAKAARPRPVARAYHELRSSAISRSFAASSRFFSPMTWSFSSRALAFSSRALALSSRALSFSSITLFFPATRRSISSSSARISSSTSMVRRMSGSETAPFSHRTTFRYSSG